MLVNWFCRVSYYFGARASSANADVLETELRHLGGIKGVSAVEYKLGATHIIDDGSPVGHDYFILFCEQHQRLGSSGSFFGSADQFNFGRQ